MSSPTTLVTWTYGTDDDGLCAEFHEGADGVRSPCITITPLGEMVGPEDDENHDWNFGISCLCSILMTTITNGTIRTPHQFHQLVSEFLEHLSNR